MHQQPMVLLCFWLQFGITQRQPRPCPPPSPPMKNKHGTNLAQGFWGPSLVIYNSLPFLSSGKQDKTP